MCVCFGVIVLCLICCCFNVWLFGLGDSWCFLVCLSWLIVLLHSFGSAVFVWFDFFSWWVMDFVVGYLWLL